MAELMAAPVVIRIGPGAYRVEYEGTHHLVYVAGTPGDRWAFADGRVYRERAPRGAGPRRQGASGASGPQALTAPMPATVIKVLVKPGAAVKKGDTVVLLEAMKMELPLRAPADATVTAVNCRAGELVQPDVILIELS